MKAELTVAAVQVNSRRGVAENVAEIECAVANFARRGGDAILFPECAVTGYGADFGRFDSAEIDEALRTVAACARSHRCHVLIGSPTRVRGRWYNSLLVFDRRGREVFRYHKIHLTPRDRTFFSRGNAPAFFRLDGIPCTAIICHERRYPELVRLPVMMGARIVFHPNAGLDPLAVSKRKRGGRDGAAVRAFENQVYYVFANTVGRQRGNLWSAGDSKIVAPDSRILAKAGNERERLVHARLDLTVADRRYAREGLEHPAFLRQHWRAMLAACRRQLRRPG